MSLTLDAIENNGLSPSLATTSSIAAGVCHRSVSSQPRILAASIVIGKHSLDPMQLWSKKLRAFVWKLATSS
jgi:hypothetical protein